MDSETKTPDGLLHHTALPQERSIRLLRIARDVADSIAITIDAFALDRLPEYEALSYTWGKATLNDDFVEHGDYGSLQTISINGAPLIITENLFDGLWELRNEIHDYLWVDALCIDQTNDLERAAQVTLMGDVYSSASRVIVWLGKEIPEIEAVSWLSEHYISARDADIPTDDVLSHLGLSAKRWSDLWQAHSSFHRRYRWFHRAWVLQEIVLARSIILRCGRKTLDMVILYTLINDAERISFPSHPAMRSCRTITVCRIIFPEGVAQAGVLRSMSYCDLSTTPEQLWYSALKWLVDVLRPQQASYLHDKIYAFLGIAQVSLPPSLSGTEMIKVDYGRPVEAVFTAFATQLLMNLPTLSPLSSSKGIGMGKRILRALPSWCPDYSQSLPVNTLVTMREKMQYGVPGFAASLCGTPEAAPCRIYERTLYVSGNRIGKIVEACQPTGQLYLISTWFDESHELTEIGGLLDVCLKLDPIYSLTKQWRIETLWRTLMLDIDHTFETSECESPADASKFSLYFGAYIAVYSAVALKRLTGITRESYIEMLGQWKEFFLAGASLGFPSIPDILRYAEESQLLDGIFMHRLFPEAREFMMRSVMHSLSRRLFITSQKWLGLGLEQLEPNDELWLFKHAAVPFILRPYGESQYQLVGEAYVHGIMHGELIDRPGGEEDFDEIEIV